MQVKGILTGLRSIIIMAADSSLEISLRIKKASL